MTDKLPWLIYGAGGVTGRLIIEATIARGEKPILAGRNANSFDDLAKRFDLPVAQVEIDDAYGLANVMTKASLVLNTAGPFEKTALPIARAAIAARIPYVDVNGEVGVFNALRELDRAARNAGIALLSGAGYGVAAGECLALHVTNRMKDVVEMRLGLDTFTGHRSAGVMASTIMALHGGGYAIRNGRMMPEPIAKHAWTGGGKGERRHFAGAPLAEAWAAWSTTNVPNIRAGIKVGRAMRPLLCLAGALLKSETIANFAIRRASARAHTSNSFEAAADSRAKHSTILIDAWDLDGHYACSELVCRREGYEVAAEIAVACAQAVQERKGAGFLTPARAFGADFILGIPGFERRTIA